MPKASLIKPKILEALKKGDFCLWDLAKQIGIQHQIVFHHLKRLEKNGLVSSYLIQPQRIVVIDSTGQNGYRKTRAKRIYQLKSLEIEDKEA
jgi:predicted ArsR family transcriptional regulator